MTMAAALEINMTRLWHLGISIVVIGWSTATQAQRDVDLVAVKTKSDCEVRVPKMPDFGARVRYEYNWGGACVGGMAQGTGELSITVTGQFGASTTTSTQTFNAGIPFGYQFTPQTTMAMGMVMPRAVGFMHDGQSVSFTEGWGLSIDGLAGDGLSMNLPAPAPITVRPMQRITAGTQTLLLMKSSCLLHKDRLPTCNKDADPEREVFEFSETQVGGDPQANFRNRVRTYCPDPHQLASCTPLAQQLGAPYRTQVMAFLQRSKPEVDALLRRVRDAVPTATSSPGNVAAAPPSAAAIPGAGSLETMSVGALFAAADEMASKGDKPGARAALRALLRRFPDHALAATAAQQLTALQGP